MAAAVYELRILLASHIGSLQNPTPEKLAARFVYALHNEALDILEGKPVDVQAALKRLEPLEPGLGEEHLRQFRQTVLGHGDDGI